MHKTVIPNPVDLMTSSPVLPTYLDLLDHQRETAFNALSGITDEELWQRPGKNEWCIGEIFNHNYLLIASTIPYAKFAWKYFRWYGERNRNRPYKKDIPDYYRNEKFPMWTGFLWTPRHKPSKPVPFEQLKRELRDLHQEVRDFYEGKDEDVLGNISLYDPYFGWLNLIVSLRLGIYHDQLHYDDVLAFANARTEPG
ncbi:MAG: DinB family protein [Anaerolineae bacterium]|nr:DinB family protein [Anaerolineae bacterium]